MLMKLRQLLPALILFIAADQAQAEGWFGGIETGYIEHKFSPLYSFPSGGADSSFTNNADGFELGLVGGYTFDISERFTIPVQARGTWNDSKWTLYLDNEPAWFSYEIPFTLGLNTQPTFMITDRLGVFVELGVLTGQINEEKNSPSSDRSSYDYSEWTLGYDLGGGVSYRFSESLEARLSYRKTWFENFSYEGRLPSGQVRERISDEPESQSLTLSLLFRF